MLEAVAVNAGVEVDGVLASDDVRERRSLLTLSVLSSGHLREAVRGEREAQGQHFVLPEQIDVGFSLLPPPSFGPSRLPCLLPSEQPFPLCPSRSRLCPCSPSSASRWVSSDYRPKSSGGRVEVVRGGGFVRGWLDGPG